MTPDQAIQHFGSISKLARALGLANPTIYDWLNAGAIPEPRQYQIELATCGRLQADKPALRTDTPCEKRAA